MPLKRDEYGFVRSTGYARAQHADILNQLGGKPGDQLYQSSHHRGVRTSKPVHDSEVNMAPGDTFALGPKITKAYVPAQLLTEWRGVQYGGYGQIEPPTETPYGFSLELKNFTLPGGVRTRAMVLLPKGYPVMPPLGFYIHESGLDAVKSKGIDVRHLFPDRTFYGAPNLTAHRWAWFCLKFEPWQPGHHTLLGVIMMVGAILSEGARS